jgi:hypothetical protein
MTQPSTGPEWQTFPLVPTGDLPRHEVAEGTPLRIGRGAGVEEWVNGVALTHPSVSRRHALVAWEPAGPRGAALVVRVLGSHAMTLVRDDGADRLEQGRTVPLADGDRLVAPGACLYVSLQGGAARVAVLDRGGRTPPAVDLFLYRRLRIDLGSGFAWVGQEALKLEPQLRALLRILAMNPRRALGYADSHELQELLGKSDDPEGQYRQQVYILRKKLGPEYAKLVQTIGGSRSYIFLPPADARYVGGEHGA